MDGDSNQKTITVEDVTAHPKRTSRKKTRLNKILRIIAAVIVLGAVVTGLLWYRHTQEVATNKALYARASAALVGSKTAELKTVVDDMQKRPKYTSNPNFLYPMVMYYVYTGNEPDAVKHYEQLKKAYDYKVGFDAVYRDKLASMDTARQAIEFLQARNKALKANVEYL